MAKEATLQVRMDAELKEKLNEFKTMEEISKTDDYDNALVVPLTKKRINNN